MRSDGRRYRIGYCNIWIAFMFTHELLRYECRISTDIYLYGARYSALSNSIEFREIHSQLRRNIRGQHISRPPYRPDCATSQAPASPSGIYIFSPKGRCQTRNRKGGTRNVILGRILFPNISQFARKFHRAIMLNSIWGTDTRNSKHLV